MALSEKKACGPFSASDSNIPQNIQAMPDRAAQYSAHCQSPIGPLTLTSDGTALTGLWMEGQKYFMDGVFAPPEENPGIPALMLARRWLDDYFAGKKPEISLLPLAPLAGSPFRNAVWRMLCEIPYGEVSTYGDIAKKMAALTGKGRMSAQAVGGAVGRNPISIIIPCHRVVGANGSLTGYSGGLDKKIRLLEFEGVDVSKLFRPKRGTAL